MDANEQAALTATCRPRAGSVSLAAQGGPLLAEALYDRQGCDGDE